MAELKPCPFCGSDAEMYTGRLWPAKNIATCESKEAAKELFKNYQAHGVVVSAYMYPKGRFAAGKGRILSGKWAVRVQLQGFVPRCTNPKCVARNIQMFHTEAEAADAWNERCHNG